MVKLFAKIVIKQLIPMGNTTKQIKIKTPRPYLSWSQLQLFERSPERYKEIYIDGRENLTNDFLELGKEMAEALEKGKSENPIISHLLTFLPSYPKVEFEMKAKVEGIPILGRLDGFNPQKGILGEFKTGKKWTQSMANKLGQITFYTLLYRLKYKKMPKEILLHWARTDNSDGELKLTGEIKTFKTQRSTSDLINFIPRIKNAWNGIIKLSNEKI